MLASFQIEEYRIEKLHIDIANAENHSQMELQYFATFRHEYKDDQWKGEVALAFRQIPIDRVPDDPSSIFEIIINGKFTMGGEQTEEDQTTFEKRLKMNGATTLIPIARAALASTFAVMGWPNKYTLPNINVLGLQWKNASDETIKPE